MMWRIFFVTSLFAKKENMFSFDENAGRTYIDWMLVMDCPMALESKLGSLVKKFNCLSTTLPVCDELPKAEKGFCSGLTPPLLGFVVPKGKALWIDC